MSDLWDWRASSDQPAPSEPLVAASADRNKAPIADSLRGFICDHRDTRFLEVGTGTGQHMEHLLKEFPEIAQYQPCEYVQEAHESIRVRAAPFGPRVKLPVLQGDLSEPHEFIEKLADDKFHIGYVANTMHVSPECCMSGLAQVFSSCIAPGGHVFIYGPFTVGGKATTESNAAFHESLRSRNPAWGLRSSERLVELMERAGFLAEARLDMPANNFLFVFRRQPSSVEK